MLLPKKFRTVNDLDHYIALFVEFFEYNPEIYISAFDINDIKLWGMDKLIGNAAECFGIPYSFVFIPKNSIVSYYIAYFNITNA